MNINILSKAVIISLIIFFNCTFIQIFNATSNLSIISSIAYAKSAKDYAELAEKFYWDGEYDKAIAEITKAIVINPLGKSSILNLYKVTYFCDRAEFYKDIEKYQLAIKDYTKELQINSDPEAIEYAYSERAELYIELNDFQNAIKDYTKLIELGHDEYYGERAEIYTNLKKYRPAIDDYTKYIKYLEKHVRIILTRPFPKYSSLAEAYANRAEAYIELGEYQLAANDYKKALWYYTNRNYFNSLKELKEQYHVNL